MKIHHYTDYNKRVQLLKRKKRIQRENQRLVRSFIYALPLTVIVCALVLFIGKVYAGYTTNDEVIINTPLVGQNLPVVARNTATTTVVSSSAKNTNTSQNLTSDTIEEYVCEVFGDDCDTAVAVMMAESHGNIKAVNENCFYTKGGVVHTKKVPKAISTFCKNGHEMYAWSKDLGLFQLNSFFHTCASSLEYKKQIDCAYKVYHEAGDKFTPWVTYNTGAYKKYLD